VDTGFAIRIRATYYIEHFPCGKPDSTLPEYVLGRPTHGSMMSLYYFRISQGRYSGASDQGSEFESRDAAWAEMTRICGDLVGGISRSLKQNADWHMELLDEARNPVFRIRLVAETVG
jgi:hypothetical protein